LDLGLEGLQSMHGLCRCPNLQVLLMDVNQVCTPLQPTQLVLLLANHPSLAAAGDLVRG
jgi:hypothetical protein